MQKINLMRNRLYRIILIFCLISTFQNTKAYDLISNDNILQLQNTDGLSNSSINSIFQDSEGRIWIGTWDGLNSYNGKSVDVYRPNIESPNSISNQVIRTICEDKKGTLWIATDHGVNRFNRSTKNFKPYFFGINQQGGITEKSFFCATDKKGRVWAAAKNSGLFLYNPDKDSFTALNIKGIDTRQITGFVIDGNNRIWLVENKKSLFCLDMITGEKHIKAYIKKKALPAESDMLCFDGKNHIWGQFPNGTLFCLDTRNPGLGLNRVKLNKQGSLHQVAQYSDSFYIATSSGLFILDKRKSISALLFEGQSVFSIYFGSQDIVWIGTDSQGIFRILPHRKMFNSFPVNKSASNSHTPIRTIVQDKDMKFWIGSKGGGLSQMDFTEGNKSLIQIKHFSVNNGLPHDAVLSLCSAKNGNILVGTDGKGLCYYNCITEKLHDLPLPEQVKNSLYQTYSIYETDDTTLWIGTNGNGLFRIDVKPDIHNTYRTTGCRQYLHNPRDPHSINNNIIYSILSGENNSLWIATRGGGLNRLDLKTNKFTAFKSKQTDHMSISSNDILFLHKDRDGELWIGTGNGLNRMEQLPDGSVRFVRYMERNGLPNSTIHAIIEDNNGIIWGSTNKGIFRLNKKSGAITNYDNNDGMENVEFADGAGYFDKNRSTAIFGGITGITAYIPDSIKTSHKMPRISFDEIFVNNAPYPVAGDSDNGYNFDYNSQYLCFRFSVFDYISNSKCRLSYKLIGGSHNSSSKSEWIDIPTREIILSNLPAGNYLLSIRYSNRDNIWSKDTIDIPFVISPPWWRSVYAYIVYGLITAAIIIFIFRANQKRLKLAHSLELRTFESNKQEEIHQAKLRFFTNIAHEFSNSITLIYGPSQHILAEHTLSDKTRYYISVIRKNAERMQSLIQQLMEFRKAETGHLSLYFEKTDIRETIYCLADNFQDIIKEKNINFTVEMDEHVKEWIVDKDALEKIIFNLLSNACKYTPEGGRINIKASVDDNSKLSIAISNTGKGISENDITRIFSRFQILDNLDYGSAKGLTRNGIGLALCQSLASLMNGTLTATSIIDKETTFLLELPVLKESCPVLEEKQTHFEPITTVSESHIINNSNKFRVLVIDDDPDIRNFLSDLLSEKFTVYSASNGAEGLALTKSLRPNIIISDVVMPVVDGIELVKELKKDGNTSHIPIILLSSKSALETQLEGISEGALTYIVKPFHPELITATVNSMLGNIEETRHFLSSPESDKLIYDNNAIDREDYEFIARAYECIDKNLDNEDYNQDLLSRDLNVSKVQFYRKIKSITGKTPSDFIRTYRFRKCESMLIKTKKTIQEIMYECGFRNKAYFFREFSKIYNCTPKEYREAQNTKNATDKKDIEDSHAES